jgi:hypothetical protein
LPIRIRPAGVGDIDAVAAVFSASLRTLSFLPILHTVVEDRSFIAHAIFPDCGVAVGEDESGILSFLARQGEEVRLLYTRPDRICRGGGDAANRDAQKSGVGALELWCFQANARALHFYEARGFRAIRFTDGARNEEKLPDIRYRWELRLDR